MTKIFTENTFNQLIETQKEFDSRIDTKNLKDSKTAYIVEFFEWYNTLETFKNWKKSKGKSLDIQLDELSDMLAFALSIYNQEQDKEAINLNESITNYTKDLNTLNENLYNDFKEVIENLEFMPELMQSLIENKNREGLELVFSTLKIGKVYYGLDKLIEAYYKKMNHNHARQDGTVDKDKGYV